MPKIGLSAVFSASDNFSGPVSQMKREFGGLASGIKAGFAGIGKVGSEVAGAVRTIGIAALGATVAVGIGMKKVIDPSLALEDSLAKVGSVITPMAGTVEDATERMKAAALDWSKHHKDSATDFLNSSYMMISAGLNEQQAAAATRTSMLLATATFGDASDAGALLATVFNNFGDKAGDANKEIGRLGDVLTKAQQTFQLKDLQQLSDGLQYGIPVALQYKIGIEDLTAVIGQLNNAGLKGSLAGTSFGASMRNIIPASKSLGFALAKNADGGVNFVATLQNMEKKFGGIAQMSDENKQRFQKAFGDEGFRALSLLLGKSDELAGNLGRVKDSANAAGNAAALIESKGSGPWKILGNQIDAIKIGLGEALAPALDQVTKKLAGAAGASDSWLGINKEMLSTNISAFFEQAIPYVTTFIGALRDGFQQTWPSVKGAFEMLGGFHGSPQLLATFKELGTTFGQLAAVAIGAAGVLANEVKIGLEVASAVAQTVKMAWDGLINTVGRVAFVIDDTLSSIGARWRKYDFLQFGGWVVRGIADGIMAGEKWVIDAVTGLADRAVEKLKSAFKIHSPSRRTAEIGEYAAEGIGVGWHREMPAVDRGVERSLNESPMLRPLEIPRPQGLDRMLPMAPWSTPYQSADRVPRVALAESGTRVLPSALADSVPRTAPAAAAVVPPATAAAGAPRGVLEGGLSDAERTLILELRAAPGTSAEVVQPPRGAKIQLKNSGAL